MAAIDSYGCLLCGAPSPCRAFFVREMMLGLRTEFEYNECGECASFQISKIPADLSKYYPRDYYSFGRKNPGSLSRALKRHRALYGLTGKGLMGAVVSAYWGEAIFIPWIRASGAEFGSRILDVGCGAGSLLRELKEVGFLNLVGLDPYLPRPHEEPGLQILNEQLEAVEGKFDLVMFHHSLEHMADPAAILKQAAAHLNPNGRVLVRIPLADSWAASHYGANWVQLDAPRHLVIPSKKGLVHAAGRAGLQLQSSWFDSHALQFYGSELYQKGVPLRSADPRRAFTKTQMAEFSRKSETLNREGNGDAGCFLFQGLAA